MSDCTLPDPEFVSDRFVPAAGWDKYITGGVPDFPVPAVEKIDRTYRSCFGGVPTIGVMYANTDANVRKALMGRQFKVRKDPAYESAMRHRQADFLIQNTAFTDMIAELFAREFDKHCYVDLIDMALQHYEDDHEKRQLRVLAMIELHSTGVIADRLWLRSMELKLKKFEWARIGKFPRIIADLGVQASLQGFVLTNLMKKAYVNDVAGERGFPMCGGWVEFIAKPKDEVINEMFTNIIHLRSGWRFYFALFSDDSVLAVRQHDGSVTVYNLDISSCDCSHTPALFQVLIDAAPPAWQDETRKLVEQTRSTMVVRSVNDKTMRVKFKPKGANLPSGSVLTTIVNNVASTLITYAVFQDPGVPTAADVIARAERVGYIVTLFECKHPSQIQFLKRSPFLCENTGVMNNCLNLGVLLRAYGNIMGDLPGRGPWQDRARAYNAGLVHAMYGHVRTPFIDKLKQLYREVVVDEATKRQITKMLAYKTDSDSVARTFSVSTEKFFERYTTPHLDSPHCTAADVEFFVETFTRCDVGWSLSCVAADVILRRDYEFACKHTWEDIDRFE